MTVNEPSSGNYYPVIAQIMIECQYSGTRLSVMPDRAQGGTSIQDGQIELMIHRRLVADDGRGVGEPLDEREPWDHTKGLS